MLARKERIIVCKKRIISKLLAFVIIIQTTIPVYAEESSHQNEEKKD